MNSPKCTCDKNVQSGFVKGLQRYKCKGCGYNCTVEQKSTAKSKFIKKQALYLYLEGPGFRSTGRFSGVSNVSVLNRIRSFGKEVQALNSESQEIEMVEVDEMKYIASDYRKAYESIISEEKHIQTKAETYTVEGYNSLFRRFLARMRRKAKCYSKKPEMLKLSILLLMHYRNKTLSILS